MKFKVLLTLKTIVFYSLLSLVLITASFYNLRNIINGTGDFYWIGPFSFFGFILLPILIYYSYRNNMLEIEGNSLKLGKRIFNLNKTMAKVEEFTLPFSDRPLFSLLKKNYSRLVIEESNQLVESINLELSRSKTEELKTILLKIQNYGIHTRTN